MILYPTLNISYILYFEKRTLRSFLTLKKNASFFFCKISNLSILSLSSSAPDPVSSVFSASPPYCPSPESPPYCAVPLLPPVPLLPQKLKKRTEKRPERSLKERTVINIYLLVFCEIYFVPLLSFPVPLLTSPSCPVPLQSPPSPVPLLTPVLSLSASPHSLSLLSRLF